MSNSYGNASAWSGFLKNKTANAPTQRTQRPSNHDELVVMVMNVLPPRAPGGAQQGGLQGGGVIGAPGGAAANAGGSGTMKPSRRIVVRLGDLRNDPAAAVGTVIQPDANGNIAAGPTPPAERTRVFKIERAKNITAEVTPLVPPATERVLHSHDGFELSVTVESLTEMGGVEPGDIVKAHGIRFNYWYSKNTGKVLTFCNVDKLIAVPGARREQFAQEMLLASNPPVQFMHGSSDEGDDEAGEAPGEKKAFQRRLGREYYMLNVFNSDKPSETAYTARPQGEIYQLDYDEKLDPNNSKISIVTMRPDVFNTAAGSGYVMQNGLKTIARGLQWREGGSLDAAIGAGKVFVTQVWLRLAGEHCAPWCIVGESDWKTGGRHLMSKSRYSILVRENLEGTTRESGSHADDGLGADIAAANANDGGEDGVDFKLVGSAQVFLCNTAAEIRRLAIPVPANKLIDTMGLTPANPAEEVKLVSNVSSLNFHSKATRRGVINLNEYTGSLTEFLKNENYDYYVVHTVEFDDVDRKTLSLIPADKQYLLFDRTFSGVWRAAIKQAEKEVVLKRYGIDPELVMTIGDFVGRASGSPTRLFYAVVKEDFVRRMQVESELFQSAVRSFVTDPDAFLVRLSGTAAPPFAPVPVPAVPAPAAPALAAVLVNAALAAAGAPASVFAPAALTTGAVPVVPIGAVPIVAEPAGTKRKADEAPAAAAARPTKRARTDAEAKDKTKGDKGKKGKKGKKEPEPEPESSSASEDGSYSGSGSSSGSGSGSGSNDDNDDAMDVDAADEGSDSELLKDMPDTEPEPPKPVKPAKAEKKKDKKDKVAAAKDKKDKKDKKGKGKKGK